MLARQEEINSLQALSVIPYQEVDELREKIQALETRLIRQILWERTKK